MGEGRQGVSEGREEGNLLGRVVQVIVAADHMGDVHGGVVHHHAEVVGGHADLTGAVAGAGDDPVIEAIRGEAGLALDEVGHHDVALRGHAEPDGRGLAGVVVRVGAALPPVHPAVVLEDLPGSFDRPAPFLEGLPRTAAAVGEPLVQQLLDLGPIEVHALHLAVGAMGALPLAGVAGHGTLVPIQAAPGHARLDDADVVVRAAGEIRILDAQDETPPVLAGEEPAEQCRAHPADVKHAGGRWGEAGDDLAGHGGSGFQLSAISCQLSGKTSGARGARQTAKS